MRPLYKEAVAFFLGGKGKEEGLSTRGWGKSLPRCCSFEGRGEKRGFLTKLWWGKKKGCGTRRKKKKSREKNGSNLLHDQKGKENMAIA